MSAASKTLRDANVTLAAKLTASEERGMILRHKVRDLTLERDVFKGAVVLLSDIRTDVDQTVASTICMLGGLTEPWDQMDYAERCARAENELRALLERVTASREEPST